MSKVQFRLTKKQPKNNEAVPAVISATAELVNDLRFDQLGFGRGVWMCLPVLISLSALALCGCTGSLIRPLNTNSISKSSGQLAKSSGQSLEPSGYLREPSADSGRTSPAGTTGPYHIERQQLRVYSNFFLPTTHPLIEELVSLRGDVLAAVGAEPASEPIHVYLFRSPNELALFASRNGDPILQRRAYFLQTADTLNVYASWSYDVQDDLRHELTHGYLHSVWPDIPLWLDEGLAEYFEVPKSDRGLHVEHLQLLQQALAAGRLAPSLDRLANLNNPAEFSQLDYAISWLWVAYLLSNSETRQILAEQIAARQNGHSSDSQTLEQALQRAGRTEASLERELQKFLETSLRKHQHRWM